jgi:hypothetical protein
MRAVAPREAQPPDDRRPAARVGRAPPAGERDARARPSSLAGTPSGAGCDSFVPGRASERSDEPSGRTKKTSRSPAGEAPPDMIWLPSSIVVGRIARQAPLTDAAPRRGGSRRY